MVIAKRPREDSAASAPTEPAPKKARHRGFRVIPANLPDGPWRRKLAKEKKELVERAKVRRAYASIRARELPSPSDQVANPVPRDGDDGLDNGHARPLRRGAVPGGGGGDQQGETIDDDGNNEDATDNDNRNTNNTDNDNANTKTHTHPSRRRHPGRREPEIFARAARGRAAKEAQLAAAQEQARQRQEAAEQRERRHRAMARARNVSADGGRGGGRGRKRGGGLVHPGQRRLGRESEVLLERVRKMVAEGGS